MVKQRLRWKTFMLGDFHAARSLDAAWRSSRDAFGPGRTFLFDGMTSFETDLPIRDLRTLLRHAGVRIPGGIENGIVWDTMSAEEHEQAERNGRDGDGHRKG